MTGTVTSTDQRELARCLAAQLRVDSIRCSTQAGSGHPTSSLSAADLMASLLVGHLRYDWDRPDLPTNDHLIFSKGHASPLLYSMFRAVGVVGYPRGAQRPAADQTQNRAGNEQAALVRCCSVGVQQLGDPPPRPGRLRRSCGCRVL